MPKKVKETGIYGEMGQPMRTGTMPPKGMHKMPNGMMMSDSEMKKTMKKKKKIKQV